MRKNLTLRDIPAEERPRERLKLLGVDNLSTLELLELILGRGSQGESVVVTAQKILANFGTLTKLQSASFEDLIAIKGIGNAKACQLLACFALVKRISDQQNKDAQINKLTLDSLPKLLQQKIGHYNKEHLVVASLDTRNNLIAMDVIAIGTLNANLAHPREIFEMAIRRHAAKIIISHNHPSGKVEPSDADLIVTEKIFSAGKLFDIPVIDHLIVSNDNYYSFAKSKTA